MELQDTKKELADSVLSGETRSLGAMSKEELLELLGENERLICIPRRGYIYFVFFI